MDYYIGVGYGKQFGTYNKSSYGIQNPWMNDDKPFSSASYSHLYFGNNSPLILSGGLSIGFIF
jgi:hypothetical protein